VAGLGRRDDAARLQALLLPLAGRNAVIDHGWAATGPFDRALAHLAAALGQGDEARAHFERAAGLARRWGAPGWELRALGEALTAGFGSEAVLARCIELAGELELPWVAGRLVEAAQKTTP
jgi:hypothetical protein